MTCLQQMIVVSLDVPMQKSIPKNLNSSKSIRAPMQPSFCAFFHVPKCIQKQPSRGVLRKRCSENIQEIYRRSVTSALVLSCKFAAYFQNTLI